MQTLEKSEIVETPAAPAEAVSLELQHEVEQWLYREAALLDDREWEKWDALFAGDGVYWVPLTHGQTDALNEVSLFYEDSLMREVRRRRLIHARAWSQAPVTQTARVVGNVLILSGSREEGELVVRSTFQLSEWRSRRDLRQQAGRYIHTLVLVDGEWRIKQKRVDLINCDGVHNALEVWI